jgi:hypothetical protein
MGGRQGPRVANIINTNRVTRRQSGGQFIVGGGHELRGFFSLNNTSQEDGETVQDCSLFCNYPRATHLVNLTLVPVSMIKARAS